jgi:hypothetical protein
MPRVGEFLGGAAVDWVEPGRSVVMTATSPSLRGSYLRFSYIPIRLVTGEIKVKQVKNTL